MKRRERVTPLAVVDLGSNAVRLQIADASRDGSFTVRAEDRAAVRLGAQVFRTGRLSSDSIAACATVLQRFEKLAQRAGAHRVRAVATSAVREASNRGQLLRAVRVSSGLTVEVISGAEEARLVCLGVLQGAPTSERTLLLDIGGGSTEVIYGKPGKLEIDVSVPLGAVRLTEKHLLTDPPTLAQRLALLKEVHDELATLPKSLIRSAHQSGTVLGIGGTCVTLARMVNPDGGRISLDELESLLEDIAVLPLAKRKRVPGIDPERADIILGGARILVEALRMFEVDSFVATAHGLRWGLVLDQ